MKSKFTLAEKQVFVANYLKGEKAKNIYEKHGISKSTFYAWVKKYSDVAKNSPEFICKTESKKVRDMVAKKNNIIKILQTVNCNTNSPLQVKLCEMVKLKNKYSIHTLCDALEVSRGTFYNHILRNKKQNKECNLRREKLKPIISDIFYEYNQIFGKRKIKAILDAQGHSVSLGLIAEIMAEMGLKPATLGAKSEYKKLVQSYKIENLLNNNFVVNRPNEVWVCDFTTIRVRDEIFYICAIIDLFARKVVGHKVAYSQTTQMLTSTLKKAIQSRNPDCEKLTFHSDRGCQFTSNAFRKLLKSYGITQSFSQKANPYNNSVAESFFSHAKTEEFYRRIYKSKAEFISQVDKYIEFFNETRPHRFNRNISPNAKERKYFETNNSDFSVQEK